MDTQVSEVSIDVVNFGSRSGSGSLAKRLLTNGFNLDTLRPYTMDDEADSPVLINQQNRKGEIEVVQVAFNEATLLYDEWKFIDTAVRDVSRKELRLWDDLRANGLTMTYGNAFSASVMQYQAKSDWLEATVSMDGLNRGKRDRPQYSTKFLPLPIISVDFNFSARDLEQSRKGTQSLDTSGVKTGTRKVIEVAEQMLAGTYDTFTFGEGSIYGYTSYPDRISSTAITDPASVGWTPKKFVDEIIDMKQELRNIQQKGPFMLYLGTTWEPYLEKDYTTTNNRANTLYSRLKEIRDIRDVVIAEHLDPNDVVLAAMKEETVRGVVGTPPIVVQWSEQGGMDLHFKVMAMLIPNFRSDYDGKCGVNHRTF